MLEMENSNIHAAGRAPPWAASGKIVDQLFIGFTSETEVCQRCRSLQQAESHTVSLRGNPQGEGGGAQLPCMGTSIGIQIEEIEQ